MLSFSLFGFPVRVHATFLILLLFILDSGLSGAAIALWTLAIFLSVVLHELGHAEAVRRFDGYVEGITIYALGGVTVWAELERPIRGWRRFVVAAAGSGVGLLVGLGLYFVVQVGALGDIGARIIRSPWNVALLAADQLGEYLIFFVGAFIWVSVVWGLVNWLPIGGLDGSKMLREVLVKVVGPSGDLLARILGVVVALAAAWWFWNLGSTIAPLIFIMFAVADLIGYRGRTRTIAVPQEAAGTDPEPIPERTDDERPD